MCGLPRPDYRYLPKAKKAAESLNYGAGGGDAEIQRDVLCKGAEPVALPLSRQSVALLPSPASYPVTQAPEDHRRRHMMPGPVPIGPYRIGAAAFGAQIALQRDGLPMLFKPDLPEAMAP